MEKDLKRIQYNLDYAKPAFVTFISNMKEPLAQWIQYRGVGNDKGRLYFVFKSSQNTLTFKLECGHDKPNLVETLQLFSNEIYVYFKALKYKTIEENK